MNRLIPTPTLFWLWSIALLTPGCGQKAAEWGEVEGVVRRDGKPLANVLVKFMPDLTKSNRGQFSEGTTDEEGRFRLVCYKQGLGAAVGWHRVVLADMEALNNRWPSHKH